MLALILITVAVNHKIAPRSIVGQPQTKHAANSAGLVLLCLRLSARAIDSTATK